MPTKKAIVVDCRGHLLGRLASTIAKQLLNGQHITCLRCEEINISGGLFRNKLKFLDFLRKKTRSNPKRGPFHFRAPSKVFWRTIRGMLPHKTARGQAALNRLQVFEGVPTRYATAKRMVIPDALRVSRLAPGRRFCVLGRLSHEMGWKYRDVVSTLEEKRKARAQAHFQTKRVLNKYKVLAMKSASQEKSFLRASQNLAKFGL